MSHTNDNLGNINFEKSVLLLALKKEFKRLYSSSNINFLKILNDFWKSEDSEELTNISKSEKNEEDKLSKEDTVYNDLEKNLIINDSFKNYVNKIVNSFDNNKFIGIFGSAGAGKSTLINTALKIREKMMNVQIITERIYPGSYNDSTISGENVKSDRSLLETVLSIFAMRIQSLTNDVEYYFVLDGNHSIEIIETLTNILHKSQYVLSNGNRINLPSSLHVVFELESIEDLHPGLIAQVSLVHCESKISDFTSNEWKIPLNKVLKSLQNNKELLKCLEISVPKILKFFDESIEKSVMNFSNLRNTNDERIVPILRQSIFGTLSTMANYIKSLLSSNSVQNFNEILINNVLAYAALWSFGGFINSDSKAILSDFIKQIFSLNIPLEYQTSSLFDLYLDIDKMKWHPWSDLISPIVLSKNNGLALEKLVKTATIEACNFNLSILSDNGFPVLFIGDRGCGKTSIIKERLKTLCSGEVAEILNVSIGVNVYVKSQNVASKLNEHLQWQHGNLYTPLGNKKLIMFLDDFSASIKNRDGGNSINEFSREILDSESFWYKESLDLDLNHKNNKMQSSSEYTKKCVKNINLIATMSTDKITVYNKRILRHFNIIHMENESSQEQKTIFSILVKGHMFGSIVGKTDNVGSSPYSGESSPTVLDHLVSVTINLQERLNHQFKSIAKPPHYYFNLHSVVQLFHNLCQAVSSNTDLKTLLNLWRNECFWTYNYRLTDPVHYNKYVEAYESAVKAEFAEIYKPIDLPLQILLAPELNLCSSIEMLPTGLVTTNPTITGSESLSSTQMTEEVHTSNSTQNMSNKTNISTDTAHQRCNYLPIKDIKTLSRILRSALNEYNKIYPSMKLHMHKSNINVISRLSRVLTFNQNMGHCLMVSDGSPGLSTTLLKLSAHIAGFKVITSSSKLIDTHNYTVTMFKNELNTIFTNTGSKGERLVLLIRDDDLSIPGVSQCIRDFIINMSIDDLFTIEQKTHIINAVRTEVVRSGLNYSREVAWTFFIQNVVRNFRFVVIVNDCHSASFHTWMQHNYHLMAKMNVLWNMGWSKQELLNNSRHIIDNYEYLQTFLSDKDKDNCCYLLQSIHSASKEFDFSKHHFNDLDPIDRMGLAAKNKTNNTTFERFVLKFCQLLESRLSIIEKENTDVIGIINVINEQEELATRLHSQLNQEKQVLQDKIDAATSILNQIGENTVIVQTQMKSIQAQINEITQLKKLVPEYKLAHDRYSYKSIAAFNRAREVVKNLDIDNLTELRSIHAPGEEVSKLIGTIIMILKSPLVDMTWNTGGKRLLANLERFTLELLTFDERRIPNETLEVLDPLLKKPSMQPSFIMEKSQMSSCRDLCHWVHHVTNYYKIMQTKVQPLHHKLENTAKEVAEAEIQMKLLEEKRKNLNSRLQDLSNNFEQATLDRYNQEIKSAKVTEMLTTSQNLLELLKKEKENATFLKSFYKKRKVNVIGSCCITAGFITYLGRFNSVTRRELLTVNWPRCLRERGLNLTFDVVDKSKGLQILFEYPDLQPDYNIQADVKEGRENIMDDQSVSSFQSKVNGEIPLLSDDQYSHLIRTMGSFVLEKNIEHNLNVEEMSDMELQQSILIVGNSDRLSVINDPSGYGKLFYLKHCQFLNYMKDKATSQAQLQIVDTENMDDQQIYTKLEESITKGQHIVIETKEVKLDSYIKSLLHYFSFQGKTNYKSGVVNSKFIQMGSRRLFSDSRFRAVVIGKSIAQDNELQSQVNIIDWSIGEDQILDFVENKCFTFAGNNFEIIQRNLEKNEKQHYCLKLLKQELSSLFIATTGTQGQLWNDENLELLKSIIDTMNVISNKQVEYDKEKRTQEEYRMKLRKNLVRLELIVQCLKSMQRINGNINITVENYLEIFESLLLTLNADLFKDLKLKNNEDNQQNNEQRSKKSIVNVDFTKDSQSLLKWSIHDELPTFQSNEEDDTELVNELLVSIDNEEKKLLAEDITGTRSSKYQIDLKSIEFYMKRRGITQSRQWKPSVSDKHEHSSLLLRNTDRSEISNKLKKVKMIASEIDLDTSNDDNNTFSLVSEESMKKIVAAFEGIIINRLKLCLTEDEFIIYRFIYYLWLSEDPLNAPNSFELEFFIHGSIKPHMRLSLQDFNCISPIPNWISSETWNEVLAASLVPGPLEELAVKVSENSSEWKEWFEKEDSDNNTWTPLDYSKNLDGEDTTIKLCCNTFIRLILLRIFKPAQCKRLIESISESRILMDTYYTDIDVIIEQSPTLKCILIVQSPAPSPDQLNLYRFDQEDCLDLFTLLAKTKSKVLSHLSSFTVNEHVLSSYLENDFKISDWVMVTNLGEDSQKHKVTNKLLNNLISHGTEFKTSLLWISCESSDFYLEHVNKDLLNHILILSEDCLKQMCQLNPKNESSINILDKVFSVTLTCFHSHGSLLNEVLAQCPPMSSHVIWSMVYINTIIMLRQVLGCRGIVTWKKISRSIFKDQLLYLRSRDLKEMMEKVEEFVYEIINVVFVKIYFDPTDLSVIQSLTTLLFSNIEKDVILLNTLELTLADFNEDMSVNMETLRNQAWFIQNNISLLTCTESDSLNSMNSSTTFKYIDILEKFLTSFLQSNTKSQKEERFDDKYISKGNKRIWSLSTNKLRAKTTFMSEKLPPLINAKTLNLDNFQFNYNSSTSLTFQSEMTNLQKKNTDNNRRNKQDLFISALLEETNLFNREICQIRSQLNLIINTLEENFIDLPENVVDVCCTLVEENVPQQWIMFSQSSYVPSTHSLVAYVDHFNRRYMQLGDFYKKIYKCTKIAEEFKIESIWLGGLKKPGIILERLKLEYSLNNGISFNKVHLLVTFSSETFSDHIRVSVKDMFIVGAVLDYDAHKTVISTKSTVTKINRVHLTPVNEDNFDTSSHYNCPIYFNQSRNTLIDYVFLESEDVQLLCLSGVFIILDMESDIKENRKENIPLLIPFSISQQEVSSPNITVARKLYEENMTLLYTLREEDEGVIVEENTAEVPVSNNSSNRTEQMNQSSSEQKSQLSYRPYSPNGPPVPSEMEISREKQNLLERNNNEDGQRNVLITSEDEFDEAREKREENNIQHNETESELNEEKSDDTLEESVTNDINENNQRGVKVEEEITEDILVNDHISRQNEKYSKEKENTQRLKEDYDSDRYETISDNNVNGTLTFTEKNVVNQELEEKNSFQTNNAREKDDVSVSESNNSKESEKKHMNEERGEDVSLSIKKKQSESIEEAMDKKKYMDEERGEDVPLSIEKKQSESIEEAVDKKKYMDEERIEDVSLSIEKKQSESIEKAVNEKKNMDEERGEDVRLIIEKKQSESIEEAVDENKDLDEERNEDVSLSIEKKQSDSIEKAVNEKKDMDEERGEDLPLNIEKKQSEPIEEAVDEKVKALNEGDDANIEPQSKDDNGNESESENSSESSQSRPGDSKQSSSRRSMSSNSGSKDNRDKDNKRKKK